MRKGNNKLFYAIIVILSIAVVFLYLNQGHASTSSITTITQNSIAITTSIAVTSPTTTVMVQAVQNPTSYHGQAPVVFTKSTTLTGDIITSGNITVLLRGVTINTSGYSLISGGTFDNQGNIVPGLASNGGASASYSYGGSGGGGWAFGCGNAGGGSTSSNGGSTVVAGGAANSGFGTVGSRGAPGSTPPPVLNNLDIQTMYNNAMQLYLEGAGGGSASNCGSTENGGSGSYGIYIQANRVIAGIINMAGQSGSGTNEEASGGGGGGVALISYGTGGYVAGQYSYSGGEAGIGNYGNGGPGGTGGVITYNYSSSPPVST